MHLKYQNQYQNQYQNHNIFKIHFDMYKQFKKQFI